MKNRRLLRMMALVLVALVPLATVQAQGDGEGDTPTDATITLNAAIQALGDQLGTPLTTADLTSWTWEEEFFSDASLGCPQPGMAYAQQITRGFKITLIYNGITYDYRLTPDGQVVILCGSEAGSAATPAPVAPAQQPANTATLAPAENPEQLLDIGIAYLNSQLGTSITRRNLSRWTWEEASWEDTALGCPQPDTEYDDSVPVWGIILKLEYVNRVYVLHMTPDGRRIMPCGDDPLLSPVVDGLVVTGDVLQPTAAAPDTVTSAATIPLLAHTGPDGNVFVGSLAEFPGQQVTNIEPISDATPTPLPRFDHVFGLYRWSPDGQQVAYVDSAAPASLYVGDATGNAPVRVQVASELTPLYSPAWSPDGREIAYITPTQTFRGANQVMEIYALPVGEGIQAQPRLLTTFEQQVGCGGGSADPADAVYNRETGFMGNALTTVWLDTNTLLVTPACTGAGLIKLDMTTGTTTELDMNITRVSLNNDATLAVGLSGNVNDSQDLILLDLATGTRQPVSHSINGTPDQVAWSADNAALLVSTVDVAERLLRSGTQETFTVYTVRLWEVDLASGNTTLHFEQQGRGIGGLSPAEDGSVIFSFVEDARNWLNAVESGADTAAQRSAAPASWLLHLQPGGTVTRLGNGGQPSLQPAQPVAVG